MLTSSLSNYSDAYILKNGTIAITGEVDDATVRQRDEINKEVVFKNYEPFIDGISKMNNTQVDNVVILLCNSIEFNNYSKTSASS